MEFGGLMDVETVGVSELEDKLVQFQIGADAI